MYCSAIISITKYHDYSNEQYCLYVDFNKCCLGLKWRYKSKGDNVNKIIMYVLNMLTPQIIVMVIWYIKKNHKQETGSGGFWELVTSVGFPCSPKGTITVTLSSVDRRSHVCFLPLLFYLLSWVHFSNLSLLYASALFCCSSISPLWPQHHDNLILFHFCMFPPPLDYCWEIHGRLSPRVVNAAFQ